MLSILFEYSSRTNRVYAVALVGDPAIRPHVVNETSFPKKNCAARAVRFVAESRSLPEFINPPRTDVMMCNLDTRLGARLKELFTRIRIVDNPHLREAARPVVSCMAYVERA